MTSLKAAFRPPGKPISFWAAMFSGMFLLAPWDAVSALWGTHPDWRSAAWWAGQAGFAAIIGTSTTVLVDTESHRRASLRVPGEAMDPRTAWRMHRRSGRQAAEVAGVGDGPLASHAMLARDTRTDPADPASRLAAARASQLSTPVGDGDPFRDGPDPDLRVACAIVALHDVDRAAAARVAATVMAEGPDAGLAEARRSATKVAPARDVAGDARVHVAARHAYWESAVVGMAIARGIDGSMLNLLSHLSGARRGTWIALSHVGGHPFHEGAGIVAHARAEIRADRAIVEPQVG